MELAGRPPDGPLFDRLVAVVRELLPVEIRLPVIEDSLRHLSGQPYNLVTLDAACWRMAGNYRRLRDGRAVPPWHSQRLPEWAPAQIVTCRRSRSRKGSMGATFGFRIMAGTCCPETALRWWSEKFCRWIAPEFGFGRRTFDRPPAYPFAAIEELVGLRLFVLIHPDECGRAPGFKQIEFSQAATSFNRQILRYRKRQDGFVCRLGERDFPCYKCPVGFLKCQAGTHRQNWVQKACPECAIPDAWFDPEVEEDLCIDCARKRAYRGG